MHHVDNKNVDICELKKILHLLIMYIPAPVMDVHVTSQKITQSKVKMLNIYCHSGWVMVGH